MLICQYYNAPSVYLLPPSSCNSALVCSVWTVEGVWWWSINMGGNGTHVPSPQLLRCTQALVLLSFVKVQLALPLFVYLFDSHSFRCFSTMQCLLMHGGTSLWMHVIGCVIVGDVFYQHVYLCSGPLVGLTRRIFWFCAAINSSQNFTKMLNPSTLYQNFTKMLIRLSPLAQIIGNWLCKAERKDLPEPSPDLMHAWILITVTNQSKKHESSKFAAPFALFFERTTPHCRRSTRRLVVRPPLLDLTLNSKLQLVTQQVLLASK